jgi:hypothetical protein
MPYITLYDGDPCEVLADDNLTLMASFLNKNHLLKLQHYYSLELLAKMKLFISK